MKKLVMFLCAVFLVFGGTSIAGAVTVDFDTLPGGGALPTHSVLTNQYAAYGVAFTGFENGVEVDTYVDDYWGSSPGGGNYWANHLTDNADNWGNQRRDVLRISFDGTAENIGFSFWNSWGSNSITFNFYNEFDALIGSNSVNTIGWDPISFGYTGVSYFEMLQPQDNWAYGLDNFNFDLAAAPVPEPATMLLLGSGLAGLAGFRRRFRKG